ncbi:hypothetical protein EDB85DRAFT_2170994 [Lactarius pseudohatsudake]|nr:hypothetical protein EDB85DRAFT_2170994 [Lactarius pseudohatsudake]
MSSTLDVNGRNHPPTANPHVYFARPVVSLDTRLPAVAPITIHPRSSYLYRFSCPSSRMPTPQKYCKCVPLLVAFTCLIYYPGTRVHSGGWGWMWNSWGAGFLLPDLTLNRANGHSYCLAKTKWNASQQLEDSKLGWVDMRTGSRSQAHSAREQVPVTVGPGSGSGSGSGVSEPRTGPEPDRTSKRFEVQPESPNRTRVRFGVRKKGSPNRTAPDRGNPRCKCREMRLQDRLHTMWFGLSGVH